MQQRVENVELEPSEMMMSIFCNITLRLHSTINNILNTNMVHLMLQENNMEASMHYMKFYEVLLCRLVCRLYMGREYLTACPRCNPMVSDSMLIKSKAKFDIAWYSTKFSELLTTIDWKRRHFATAEYCQMTNTCMFCLQNVCLRNICLQDIFVSKILG